MCLNEFSADRGVQFYTIGRNPGRGASTGGGRSNEAQWEPGGYRQPRCRCGSGVGSPRVARRSANHRPAVRAEGNATVVCSAQSSASRFGGGDSDVFSTQPLNFHTFFSKPTYLYFSLSSDNFVCEDYVRCDHMPCCAVSIKLCSVGRRVCCDKNMKATRGLLCRTTFCSYHM